MRQCCLIYPISWSIVLQFLARAIREEKEIRGIQKGKEEIKLFHLADNMISEKYIITPLNLIFKKYFQQINTQKPNMS